MRRLIIGAFAAWIVAAVGCSSPAPFNEGFIQQNPKRRQAEQMIQRLEADEYFPAPHFTLESAEGKWVSLSDYDDHVVFVNFWAAWCPPCRIDMRNLQTLYETYADQKFVILAISMDKPFSPDAPAFAKQRGITFPILEPTRRVNEAYGEFNAVPVTFVINREGLVVEIFSGTHPLGVLRTAVLRLL